MLALVCTVNTSDCLMCCHTGQDGFARIYAVLEAGEDSHACMEREGLTGAVTGSCVLSGLYCSTGSITSGKSSDIEIM